MKFEDAIKAIAQHSFESTESMNCDYPMILSIENHCSVENQDKMAEIMHREFGDRLVQDEKDPTRCPTPNDLKGKFIVKAKKLKPRLPSSGDDQVDGFENGEVSEEDDSHDIEAFRWGFKMKGCSVGPSRQYKFEISIRTMNSTDNDVIEPTDWHDTRVSTIDRNRNRDSYRDRSSYRESDFTPAESKTSSFIGNGQAYDETDFFNLSNNSSNKNSATPVVISRQTKSKKGSKKMKLSQKLSDIVIYTQAWFQI